MTLLQVQTPTITVGMADMKVAATPGSRLVTYALGSCLGIAIHDPVAQVAGLLHVMLPSSKIDAGKAQENPYMFVDTGVPALFRTCYQQGAKKERIVVKVAGGSYQGDSEEKDRFQIGKRNILTLRQLLWKNGVMMQAHDVGGRQTSRTMYIDVVTGDVVLKINGLESRL